MEESEVCSLPGGLASVRRQFETQEIATSNNVTQFHFQHRTVQVLKQSIILPVHQAAASFSKKDSEMSVAVIITGLFASFHLLFYLDYCMDGLVSKPYG